MGEYPEIPIIQGQPDEIWPCMFPIPRNPFLPCSSHVLLVMFPICWVKLVIEDCIPGAGRTLFKLCFRAEGSGLDTLMVATNLIKFATMVKRLHCLFVYVS